MKKLKTKITTTNFLAVLTLALALFSFSCDGEDGVDGEDGAQGEQGINGTDGADGADGADGVDGVDGEDGNANVQTFIYDSSSDSGTGFTIVVPAITQEVMDNDVVLAYYNTISISNLLYPIPGIGANGLYNTRFFLGSGYMEIKFHDFDGSPYTISAGDVDSVKIIIIESTSTTTLKTTSKKEAILNELNSANVDVNDYYAVCDYYGIAY